jgi:hypothetical protein
MSVVHAKLTGTVTVTALGYPSAPQSGNTLCAIDSV